MLCGPGTRRNAPAGPVVRTRLRTESSARFIRLLVGFAWQIPKRTRCAAHRSAPLGFPIAAALAGRRPAPPGSAATAAGEATGAGRALLATLDGGGHAAALVHRAGQLDAGG